MAQPLRKTLRVVRQLAEVTQVEMAQLIGMDARAYGRFERNSESLVPSASTLRRMYEVLSSYLVQGLLGAGGAEPPGPAVRPPPGGRRPRQPASRRPGAHTRTRQTRRLALRVDVE